MWPQEFEKAKWNGQEFNLLTSGKDGGRRLQITEYPGSDNVDVLDLGAKAKTYKIQAIFAGPSSLNDANAFIGLLESEPSGKLQHPYEGELDLHYQTYSQSYSTNEQGRIVLDISFVQRGMSTEVPTFFSVTTADLTSTVVEHSSNQFVEEVKQASPDEISRIQTEFRDFLTGIQNIADRIQKPGDELNEIHNQIKAASVAISIIANEPRTFLNTFVATLQGISAELNAITIEDQTNPDNPLLITVSPEQIAQTEFKTVESNSETNHVKMLATTASINTNRYLIDVTDRDEQAVFSYDADTVLIEITNIITRIGDRIDDATQAATYESMDLLDSLQALNVEVSAQRAKVQTLLDSTRTEPVYKPVPLLALAQELDVDTSIILSMNKVNHPLFITGNVRWTENA